MEPRPPLRGPELLWAVGVAIICGVALPPARQLARAGQAGHAAALGVDAYLAGVTDSVERADVMAERARRIAVGYQIWVAVASFAGPTGGGFDDTAGRSGIWAPEGVEVVRAGPQVGAGACDRCQPATDRRPVPRLRLRLRCRGEWWSRSRHLIDEGLLARENGWYWRTGGYLET